MLVVTSLLSSPYACESQETASYCLYQDFYPLNFISIPSSPDGAALPHCYPDQDVRLHDGRGMSSKARGGDDARDNRCGSDSLVAARVLGVPCHCRIHSHSSCARGNNVRASFVPRQVRRSLIGASGRVLRECRIRPVAPNRLVSVLFIHFDWPKQ